MRIPRINEYCYCYSWGSVFTVTLYSFRIMAPSNCKYMGYFPVCKLLAKLTLNGLFDSFYIYVHLCEFWYICTSVWDNLYYYDLIVNCMNWLANQCSQEWWNKTPMSIMNFQYDVFMYHLHVKKLLLVWKVSSIYKACQYFSTWPQY